MFFPFLVVACSSIAIKHYQNPGNNQVADIPAVQVRFDRYVPPKIKDLRERTYYTRFLQGVNDLNGGDYNAALEKFSACARYFNDEGNALFMRAQCHVKLGSLTNALKDFYHAKQAGYEEDKTGPRIAQVLELLGHARLKEQSWAEALGYFKAAHVYGKENRYADNVLFCYF